MEPEHHHWDHYEATAEVIGGVWRITVPDIGTATAETKWLSEVDEKARRLVADHLHWNAAKLDVHVAYLTAENWTDPDGQRYCWIGAPPLTRYTPVPHG